MGDGSMTRCADSSLQCTEILTRDDSDDYDERVLGIVPNGYRYGYCCRCKQPFWWDVARQCWMPTTKEIIAEDVEFQWASLRGDTIRLRKSLGRKS